MQELLYTAIAVVVVGIVLTILATKAASVLARIERYLTYAATVIIIFVMVFICGEVVMRYIFNSPIPGHLEGAELFVPIIVFFAISYTQSQRGHVGMTLIIDNLAPRVRQKTEIVTLLLSVLTCAVLSYFCGKYSLQLWEFDDVTMSPPYWRTWPSGAAISLGYGLIAMRLYLQVVHLIAPQYYAEDDVIDEENLMASPE